MQLGLTLALAPRGIAVDVDTLPEVSNFTFGPQPSAGADVPYSADVTLYSAAREPYDVFIAVYDDATIGDPDAAAVIAGVGFDFAWSILDQTGAIVDATQSFTDATGTYRAAMVVRDDLGEISEVAVSAAFTLTAAPVGPAYAVDRLVSGLVISSAAGASKSVPVNYDGSTVFAAGDAIIHHVGAGARLDSATFMGRAVDTVGNNGSSQSVSHAGVAIAILTAGEAATLNAGTSYTFAPTFQFNNSDLIMEVHHASGSFDVHPTDFNFEPANVSSISVTLDMSGEATFDPASNTVLAFTFGLTDATTHTYTDPDAMTLIELDRANVTGRAGSSGTSTDVADGAVVACGLSPAMRAGFAVTVISEV